MPSKYLGKSFWSTGTRLSLMGHTIEGKRTSTLITWSDRKCEVCHKFIGGGKQKLCTKCYQKVHSKQNKINHRELRDNVNFYGMQTIRELSEFPLPHYLRSNLRCYC
jgi:hypothetical protein